MSLSTEDEVIAYRRMCELIVMHPAIWNTLLRAIRARRLRAIFPPPKRYSLDAMEQAIKATAHHGVVIAKEELDYWKNP